MIKNIKLTIWNRKFILPVMFDCYSNEKVTEQQIKAVDAFLHNPSWIENAKPLLEKHCKKSLEADDSNSKKDNIFSYVKPEYIYVKRDEDMPFSRLSIMLKYKYDLSHGLAVIFDDKGTIKIASQDEIL